VTAARLRLLIHEQLGAAASLRALLHELGEHAAGLERESDDEVAERIAALVERGRLHAEFELREPAITTPPVRVELPTHKTEQATVLDQEVHWIEIQLLDEDGEGIAGERCQITLPDRRRLLRTTDRHGLVRIEKIAAGNCEVSFPDLDSEAIEPL
jgi:hypothetical protein